jgi:hypothetical protein
MGMGRREQQRRQEELWIAHTELPRTVAHPSYEQLNRLLEARGFDEWVEQQCTRFYAEGYHSNDTLQALAAAEVRTYISEPDRGRRCWTDKTEARPAVYGNRRRIRGGHGKELLRRRGELLERSFAHAYETGGTAALALAGAEEHSQARADSSGRIQSVAGDAAVAGQGHATRSARPLGGPSVDFIAVLDRDSASHRTGMRIGPDASALTRRASQFLSRSRRSEQTTSATGC